MAQEKIQPHHRDQRAACYRIFIHHSSVNAVKELIEGYQNKYNRTIYLVDGNGEIKLAGTGFTQTKENREAI